MHVYHLSDATLDGYLRDLIQRIGSMASPPEVLCALTGSGKELLRRLVALAATMDAPLVRQCRVLYLGKEADGDLVMQGLAASELRGSHCLLMDSAVHSGRLIDRAKRFLIGQGVTQVSSYALVLKAGSIHIPTFWGMMIANLGRALFGMATIPNNRLSSGSEACQQPLTISLLQEEHCKLPPVVTGLASMDRATWSDRYFDMQASGHTTRSYVLERGSNVIGYLTCHGTSNKRSLHVDEVALASECQGQRIGGVLLRFAMTYARQSDCARVRLHALQTRQSFYEGNGFNLVPGKPPLRLDDELYVLMEKQLLHEPEDRVDEEA
jgi:ribosomal protein S18 acetylase RimI-like enzyme